MYFDKKTPVQPPAFLLNDHYACRKKGYHPAKYKFICKVMVSQKDGNSKIT